MKQYINKGRLRLIKKYSVSHPYSYCRDIDDLIKQYRNGNIVRGTERENGLLFFCPVRSLYEFKLKTNDNLKDCILISVLLSFLTEKSVFTFSEKEIRLLFIEFLKKYEIYLYLQNKLNSDTAEAIVYASEYTNFDFLYETGLITPNGKEFNAEDLKVLDEYFDIENQDPKNLEILIKYFEKRLWKDNSF